MSKWRVLVLLAAICLSAAAMQASPLLTSHERVGGCHGHGHQAPTRQPADYSCCVAGHDSVIVPSSLGLLPCLQIVPSVFITTPALQAEFTDSGQGLQVSSGDPPDELPLRI